VFVIDLASRRVQILGSPRYPEAMFMQQAVRTLTAADGGGAWAPRVLICDRDRKWSGDVRYRLQDAGMRVVLTPARAPNANAYAERFVRSIKEECLDRLIPIGQRHFRRAVAEYYLGSASDRDDRSCATASATRGPPQFLIWKDLSRPARLIASNCVSSFEVPQSPTPGS
jgi:transposase InsO family protein